MTGRSLVPTSGRILRVLKWAIASAFVSLAVSAQTPQSDPFGLTLRPPTQIVLYRNESLRYRDFVEPLACMLRNVLVAPVAVKDANFILSPGYLATPTQYSVETLVPAINGSLAAKNPEGTFSFLLVSEDLKAEPFHYVFSMAEGNAKTLFHVGVLSIARLDPNVFATTPEARADTTALRAYKLLLKAVARLAGYQTQQGCILAFPRSLMDLDAKSSTFCSDDEGVLVAGGVLRAHPGKGCNVISDFGIRTNNGRQLD